MSKETDQGRIRIILPVAIVFLLVLSMGIEGAFSLESTSTKIRTDSENLITDEVVVVFKDSIPANIEQIVLPYGSISYRSDTILKNDILNFVSIKITPLTLRKTINDFKERDDVEHVYQPTKAELFLIPNDVKYPAQWGPDSINLPEAWEIETGSHDVKIAVIDTGVTYLHEDLSNTYHHDSNCGPDINLLVPGPLAQDEHGHGSHVNGILAGTINNNLGIAGTTQSCVMNIKAISGAQHAVVGAMTHVGLGIVYAVENGADIISMSVGSDLTEEPVLRKGVEYAHENGVLMIAAAGNKGCDADSSRIYPATYAEVMAVSSIDQNDEISTFSSCGSHIEISAPGTSILSTGAYGVGGNLIGSQFSQYQELSGTSMSTPFVSGVAGLMKSINNDLTAEQMRCILKNTSIDLGDAGHDSLYGYGKLDAYGAVIGAQDPESVGC